MSSTCIASNHRIPRHSIPLWHSIEHLTSGAHIPSFSIHPDQRRRNEEVGREPFRSGLRPDTPADLELRRPRARRHGEVVRVAVGKARRRRHLPEDPHRHPREATREVPAEHGIVEERLLRRRRRRRGVEHLAGGAGVPEAEVAGDEEGRDVAVGGEPCYDGERVRPAVVGGGVVAGEVVAGDGGG
ncbi:hypothetical protein EE612_056376 [Oryza sativa]|nr:hypothetical protein EE612_056376 [Oryza sativa]